MSEHWFDLLVARRTRAQALRAALVGAALTIPLVRTGASGARTSICRAGMSSDPGACVKGCLFTAQRTWDVGLAACGKTVFTGAPLGRIASLGSILGLAAGAVNGAATGAGVLACSNAALVQMKAASYDCVLPGCSGFDPCNPLGPCNDCAAVGAWCCSSSLSAVGFTCCLCCDPNGDGCSPHPC